MRFQLSYIFDSIGAELHGATPSILQDVYIDSFDFDTRKLHNRSNSIFLCLATSNKEIHKHINKAIQKGVQYFICPKRIKNLPSGSVFFQVENVLNAFQRLAKYHRSTYKIPVVGITGSNGKTIIKEWLSQILEASFDVCKSPASYNSQLGVPLSLMNLHKDSELGVFEAGISKNNEMHLLNEMIQPSIGILSNIGDAHNEGFESIDEKLQEKLILFRNSEKLILESTSIIENVLQDWNQDKTAIIRWSAFDKSSDIFVEKHKEKEGTVLEFHGNIKETFQIPFQDNASIKNCIHVIICALELGLNNQQIQQGLNLLEPVSMRLSLTKGKHNCLIINDSYNADLTSLENALDFANEQRKDRTLHLVLTEFDQIKRNKNYFEKRAQILSKFPIEKIHFIGEKDGLISEGVELVNYESIEDLLITFQQYPITDSLILLKGARRFHLESLNAELELQAHRTELTISLDAIANNVKVFRDSTTTSTQILAVIKASAYGTDSITLAKHLVKNGVHRLAVAYYEEAKELREEGIQAPLMIMNPDPVHSRLAKLHDLELEVYSLRQLKSIVSFGGKEQKIHIKVDTGMHRLGFTSNDIPDLLKYLSKYPKIKIVSVFSHFACAENPKEDTFTHQQNNELIAAYKTISLAIGYMPIKHICNSNAAARFPNYHHDMIRLGIGLYGYLPLPSLQIAHGLFSYIAQVKTILPGDTVGYNRAFMSEKQMQIATVSIGFADGLSRKLGNGRFYFKIAGKKATTLGNISMDTCAIDITGMEVEPGDRVTLFDTLEGFYKMAKVSEKSTYELISGIGSRVVRRFIKE